MRKLGLRVLAGSLAVLMTASVFGPVTPARAENDLLIAPAPIAVNTLYVTKDMVDSDNEIIISGEKWDRIVVTKEAAAANIYFDEVEVGELVIESGSKSVVQLWKVDAGKVTVQEPELKEIDVTTLRTLLVEEETRQQAMDYFMRVQAENEQMLRSAPLIMTMEDAAVETISAGANVRLDLHEGDVKALNVEASAKLDRMDVTLEGYSGEVVYSGNDAFSIVNLKNVDSRISKLTVADSSASNYLNVTSRDSVALNVEVAGDAKVSLNIPMGELNITEAAKAASVDVLNAVDNMNVSGSNAKVEIAPIGNVAKASITGDKAEIGGAGTLGEAVILGKEVYVSTKGTTVEGENSYVEPVYVPPQVVVKNTYDNMEAGATTLTKNSNGTATISFSGQYQSATFNVPANVDVDRIRSIVVEVTTSAQIGLSILTTDGTNITKNNGDGEYPGYGISELTKKEFTYSVDPREQKVAKINLMSLNAAQPDLVLESVTFNLYEEGKIPTPTPTPTPVPLPPVEPGSLKTFTPRDCDPALEGHPQYNPYTAEYLENGAIRVDFGGQFKSIDFKLPEKFYPVQYGTLRIKLATGTTPKKDEVAIKLVDSSAPLGEEYGAPKPVLVKYGIIQSPEGYYEINLDEVSKYVIDGVSVMSNEAACSCDIYEITFVARGGAEPTPGVTGTPAPTPGVTGTPEPTPGVTGTPEPTPGVTETPEPTPGVTETPEPTPGVTETPEPTPGVTVTPEPTPEDSVEITVPAKTTLAIGGTLELSATASGTVTWSSSDAAIATVDTTGTVTAKAAGTVTITATCGEATDEVELTVGLAVTDKTFTPKDCNPDMHGWTQSGQPPYPYEAEYFDDTAIKVNFAEQYASITFNLPEGINLSMYDKLRIKLDTNGTADTDKVGIKLMDNRAQLGMQYGAPVPFFEKLDYTQSPAGVIEVDLKDKSEYVTDRVAIVAAKGACETKIYEISFVAKDGAVLTLPTDGTFHDLNKGNIIKIDTNFTALAGKKVKISAEVFRFGDVLVKAHGQFVNQWGTGLHWNKSVNTAWTDFGGTFTVPAEWANATDAQGNAITEIYYGINLLLDKNTDYSTTKFYYRNFNVEEVAE